VKDAACFERERFRRAERLKRRNEIREVFDKGRRTGCRGAKLFVLRNNLPRNRICFTFSRGFGNAVKRNRARRLGREAYRNLKSRLQCGYDLILLFYPEDSQTFAGRREQLEYLFTRAGLL
jgi:ribonuclease P protein component